VLAALDSVAVSVIAGKARKLIEDEKQVQDVAGAVRLSDTNRQLISTNLPIVLQKHGVSSDHLPELALAAGLAGYGSGFMVAVQKLDSLLKSKEEKAAASSAVPAP
jgi:hypothetical protein